MKFVDCLERDGFQKQSHAIIERAFWSDTSRRFNDTPEDIALDATEGYLTLSQQSGTRAFSTNGDWHMYVNPITASILVVEDKPAIQELIAAALTCAGHKVIRAGDAESAQLLVSQALPDLILLDRMLPGISGIELARRLRSEKRTLDVPIIILSEGEDEQDMITGLEAGADDYIAKPFSSRELLLRVMAVLRRCRTPAAAEAIVIAGLLLDPAKHCASVDGQQIELGPTEFRLLHFFMTHPQCVHSRARLREQLWNKHVHVADRTIDVHIRRLRAALEKTGHDVLIQTMRGNGYFMAESFHAGE